MLGIPFRFSATPPSIRRPPPTLGEHTDEILRDLNVPQERVAELRAEKVI
jgi:crotonobetainyl-CoA:carnitine CoA-transferase CaiB-like acyl-CoA transferase